ncbi:uncharacterized protein LOC111453057 isoform X1 [Cucurbita moschata]|uniref:Uncharacterized protein LOC111453057 isoform X1 n=1 Tax=Cucurbita moschata TaxID=3662 RepID=A0A6J1GD11_CUCMO|nr:uncharacterized protein LOC111453057 isoform X1 [Cucurbita moschata]
MALGRSRISFRQLLAAVGICSFSGTTEAASNAAIIELHPFQVDGLVIFLMMFQNNGACMQTSLAVQTAPLILLLHASYLFSTNGFPWQSYEDKSEASSSCHSKGSHKGTI